MRDQYSLLAVPLSLDSVGSPQTQVDARTTNTVVSISPTVSRLARMQAAEGERPGHATLARCTEKIGRLGLRVAPNARSPSPSLRKRGGAPDACPGAAAGGPHDLLALLALPDLRELVTAHLSIVALHRRPPRARSHCRFVLPTHPLRFIP